MFRCRYTQQISVLSQISRASSISKIMWPINIILFFAIVMYSLRMFIKPRRCRLVSRLDGKNIVITGSSSGIGYATALALSQAGARVIMACKDLPKAKQAVKEIQLQTRGQMAVYHLDLASLDSVRRCAEAITANEPPIDVLINNAGLIMASREETEDGFEVHMGVNHLGPYLFTRLLLPKMINNCSFSRIINVSSEGHKLGEISFEDPFWKKRSFSIVGAYGQSKLANILFILALTDRLRGRNVRAYALHPGLVDTGIARHLTEKKYFVKYFLWPVMRIFAKSATDGAQTTLHCVYTEDRELYFSDCSPKRPDPRAEDQNTAEKLWKWSEEMVGLTSDTL